MRLGKPLAVGISKDPDAGEPHAEERGAGSWEAVEPLGGVPAVAAVAGPAEPGGEFVGSLVAR